MKEPTRRDLPLLVAFLLSGALAATIVLLPAAAWRIPLALLGGIWAPGYALLCLAYPRGALSQLERHALAACAGLCLLPLLTLLSSESVGLTQARVALVAAAFTGVAALGALLRTRRLSKAPPSPSGAGVGLPSPASAPQSPASAPQAEPLVRTRLPSTRATLALCLGALLVAAGVEATSHVTARPAPPSLALTAAGGPLDLDLEPGEQVAVIVEARAGASAAMGELVVTWDGAPIANATMDLAARAAQTLEVPIPTDTRGDHALVVTWLGLQTHATFRVGS